MSHGGGHSGRGGARRRRGEELGPEVYALQGGGTIPLIRLLRPGSPSASRRLIASVNARDGRTVAVYPRWQIVVWIVAWVTWASTAPGTGARWWSCAVAVARMRPELSRMTSGARSKRDAELSRRMDSVLEELTHVVALAVGACVKGLADAVAPACFMAAPSVPCEMHRPVWQLRSRPRLSRGARRTASCAATCRRRAP